MKYVRLYLLTLKMNIMDMVANRGNFAVWAVVNAASFIVNIAFFDFIYSQINTINGWNYYQALIVLGVSSIFIGLGSASFFPFFWTFPQQIRKGDFDIQLIKPIDIQFQSAFSWLDLEDIVSFPLGVAIIVFALHRLGFVPSLINIFLFMILVVNAMVLLFSLATLILSMAFKFVRVDASASFFWSIVNISRYPAKAINATSVFALMFVVPLALLTSVPAEVIFGRIEGQWVIGALASGVLLFLVSRWVFLRSVKDYSSASS